MQKKKEIPLCPTCEIPVQKFGRLAWFFTGLFTAGCLTVIVVGVFLLPLTPLLLLMPPIYRCKQCGIWWRRSQIKEKAEI